MIAEDGMMEEPLFKSLTVIEASSSPTLVHNTACAFTRSPFHAFVCQRLLFLTSGILSFGYRISVVPQLNWVGADNLSQISSLSCGFVSVNSV